MSFRKRNVVIGSPSASPKSNDIKVKAQGTRASPVDGSLTTSTGTYSLDQLMAGHAGMPVGTSILVEEVGTTDFSGILLRYYAAEGLVQGHHVHVLGHSDSWRRELPGLATCDNVKATKKPAEKFQDGKMKIAWRYEALSNRADPKLSYSKGGPQLSQDQTGASSPFCHSFDLTKRLENSAIHGQLHAVPLGDPLTWPAHSPFENFLADVSMKIRNSPISTMHRILVPGLLSPTLYGSSACEPQQVLRFLHGLRGLLRNFSNRLTAMVTMSISLYPRAAGVTRWAELLSDGVLELVPLHQQKQHQLGSDPTNDEKAQGLLRVHCLPIFHEKGGGLEGGWLREDMSFRLSSSRGLVITPFSLPPVGDEESSAKPVIKDGKAKPRETLDF